MICCGRSCCCDYCPCCGRWMRPYYPYPWNWPHRPCVPYIPAAPVIPPLPVGIGTGSQVADAIHRGRRALATR